MDFVISWLETNAVLLGSLAAVATIATLFLVNGTQILSAFFFNPNAQLSIIQHFSSRVHVKWYESWLASNYAY